MYRNLFFFPGGFFEQLKREARERGFKIILLVTPHDGKKYRGRLGEGEGEVYDFETVKVPYPKRIFGKLFYFFYSYLIYTSTTRLLATMGTRPDEPPAGGRGFLAPLKWGVARCFGWSRVLRRRLVPAIFIRLYPERPFQELFRRYRPLAVFSAHLYGWFDQHLVAEAKRQGVPTVGMVANWDHMDKYFLAMHVDKLCVQSEELTTAAIRYQAYAPGELLLTGYPYFDFLTDRSRAGPRADVLARIGFPPDAKFVLYVSGSSYCPDEPDIIEAIVTWIAKDELGEKTYLLVRPYLGGRTKDREFDEEKYNRFEAHPRVRFYRHDFWDNYGEGVYFMNILRESDAVLSIFSTMALEAAVLDRPILAIDFDGYARRPFKRSIRRFALFEHFKHVRATGAMPVARNFGELKELLQTTLQKPQELAPARERLRRELAGPLDGRAATRLVGALVSSIPFQKQSQP
ncbi:MAG: hypothetical protein G01um101472_519 [Parcubacteria group bacterium Gr01-1014_72]|nr:MAG: hypothetical protein G01um101472_519 [Parcubacteria group bacterium Gr01-1014_72]